MMLTTANKAALKLDEFSQVDGPLLHTSRVGKLISLVSGMSAVNFTAST
jgi:hypothetical protein